MERYSWQGTRTPRFTIPLHIFIYPLKFLCVWCTIANYMHIAVQICRTFSSCMTETLYPLTNNSPFLPPHRPWQPPFYFLFPWIWLDTQVKSCNICLFYWLISLNNVLKAHPWCSVWQIFIKTEKYSIMWCVYNMYICYR